MREPEMAQLAGWMGQVREQIRQFSLPEEREARTQALKEFRAAIGASPELKTIREDVRVMCRQFPVPGTSL
jgi:hypothetical protein